jgi:hypothetical protein
MMGSLVACQLLRTVTHASERNIDVSDPRRSRHCSRVVRSQHLSAAHGVAVEPNIVSGQPLEPESEMEAQADLGRYECWGILARLATDHRQQRLQFHRSQVEARCASPNDNQRLVQLALGRTVRTGNYCQHRS